MGFLGRVESQATQATNSLVRLVREGAPKVFERIAKPKFLEKKIDGATRSGQILSLIMLGPLIVVSLALIQVLNELMADIFGANDLGDQTSLIGWLITAITAGLFLLAAYSWFMWVRTSGFGYLSYD